MQQVPTTTTTTKQRWQSDDSHRESHCCTSSHSQSDLDNAPDGLKTSIEWKFVGHIYFDACTGRWSVPMPASPSRVSKLWLASNLPSLALNFLSLNTQWLTNSPTLDPQKFLHAPGMLILFKSFFWNFASRPPLFLPPYCSTNLSKYLTLWKFSA